MNQAQPAEPIWIGSPTDVRHGEAAIVALTQHNDELYWTPGIGTLTVPMARWQAAQRFERSVWLEQCLGAESDRNHEHTARFGEYAALPVDLGRALEVGCGPFTQLQTIAAGRKLTAVTLLDPLIYEYMDHPHCSYKNGQLCGVPTSLHPIPVERANWTSEFDTVVCINVLEHVHDAQAALQAMHAALAPNGTLVFGERTWDRFDPKSLYDVGHPIRITKSLLDQFVYWFDLLYDGRKGDDYYFIGKPRK